MSTYDSLLSNVRDYSFSYAYNIEEKENLIACWLDHYGTSKNADVSAYEEPFENFMLLGLRKCFAKLKMTVFQSEEEDLMLFWSNLNPWPKTRETLLLLQQKYKIGILSNGSDRQLRKLAANSLPDVYFSYFFGSTGAKCFKPNPLIYKQSVDVTWYELYEVLHVAGSRFDVKGAKSFGIFTGLNGILDNKNEPFIESETPCIKVNELSELVPILMKK